MIFKQGSGLIPHPIGRLLHVHPQLSMPGVKKKMRYTLKSPSSMEDGGHRPVVDFAEKAYLKWYLYLSMFAWGQLVPQNSKHWISFSTLPMLHNQWWIVEVWDIAYIFYHEWAGAKYALVYKREKSYIWKMRVVSQSDLEKFHEAFAMQITPHGT